MNAFYPINRRLTAVLVGLVALLGLSAPAQAQATCNTGSAEADLDINNVRAKLYNIGGLFWRGSGAQYLVPKESGLGAVFASGIWVGGKVNGDLRFAGSTYGPWEYWPGPLTAAGTVTPAVCQTFDRFWKVNISDIRAYNTDGTAAPDLQSWPIAYGAPFFVDTNGNGRRDATLDANGDGTLDEPRVELSITSPGYGTRQIDLAGNERPDIIGDQGIWWVMNDKGGSHDWSEQPAIGLEVRALAFAFQTADALNNTTFYRYQFIYRGTQDMTDSYIGIFSDPDLGDATDDFVGSDPSLGLGFVYNGDSFDANGYGPLPPALGYDFFQGPLVGNGAASSFNDGIDNDGDGDVDEEGERLAVEKFFYFTNGGTVTSDPGTGEEAYSYMQGLWKDGTPLKEGGDGYNTNGPPVDFAFPGDPPRFWSEYNVDGTGRANNPADRRFGVSSGPFTFKPGQTQEIVFGIVWSQAVSATVQPQIVSVRQLKFDDRTVQAAFNAEFSLPEPPPSVAVVVSNLNQEVILEWNSVTGDIDDIFDYDVESPFAPPSAADNTYSFEGFKIIQYRSPADQSGTLIATYDIANNVTTVVDEALDPVVGEVVTGVVAQGADNGTATTTPTSISITTDIFTNGPLRNGTSYYYGIQPYAVNEASTGQKVFAAPVTRVEVRPTLVGGIVTNVATGTSVPGVAGDGNIGGGSATATVLNPASVTGATYNVEFFQQVVGIDDHGTADPGDDTEIKQTSYRIVNTTTGATIFGGEAYFAANGTVPPQDVAVFQADGLSFDVLGPEPGPLFPGGGNAFVEITGPGGVDACGPGAASTPGCSLGTGNNIYSSFNSTQDYVGYHVGDGPEASIGGFAPNEFEIRFTAAGSYAYYPFSTGNAIKVPFEVWDIGLTPPGQPNDPSDDVQMIANMFADGPNECVFEYGGPSPFAGLGQATQRIYAYYGDYAAWAAAVGPLVAADPAGCPTDPATAAAAGNIDLGRGRPLQRFVLVDASGNNPNTDLEGTVIRFYTTDPNQPGDTFAIETGEFGAVASADQDQEAQEAALDLMAITPNPYRGFSGYESSGSQTVARFVNLPAQATIRIFTLSGTLVKTLVKSNVSTATIDWNLKTEANLPVASGLYLIHIEGRRADSSVIGERILKFGVIQRRTQLDVL